MTGSTKRFTRLLVAVIFVVPVIVGSLVTTSVAAPTQEEVQAARDKAERDRPRPRDRDRAVQRGPRPAGSHPGEAGSDEGREGRRRCRRPRCHRRPGSSRGRGVHRHRLTDRRAARSRELHRVLRPTRVHGRGRSERRRPRRGRRQCPSARRVGRPEVRRSGRRAAGQARRHERPALPDRGSCSPSRKRWRTSSTRSIRTISLASVLPLRPPQRQRRRTRARPPRAEGAPPQSPPEAGTHRRLLPAGSAHRPPSTQRSRCSAPRTCTPLQIPTLASTAQGSRCGRGRTAVSRCRTRPLRRPPREHPCRSDHRWPGDLLFFYSPISHVALYIGGGMMIHARHPGPGGQVQIGSVAGYGTPVTRVVRVG